MSDAADAIKFYMLRI